MNPSIESVIIIQLLHMVIVCIIANIYYDIIITVPEGKVVGFLSRGILSEIRIPVLTNQIAGFFTTIV